jgi:type II secretory pathway predicted ATPase ExeA
MNSYLNHFGLKKAPFSAHVAGNNVFVAPQVAAIAAAMKKALSTEDAVVSLSGPVGSGKTTIAKRALESIGQNRGIVTIGRMPFGPDEVLEILLAGLGARQLPKSTVHRFATFRRLLQQFAEQNTRVFVLVEDAGRIGPDALSELEALTAADAGVSNGANLILLGDDGINDLLRDPKMARLKQRLRTRQTITAQSPGELQGYLKHCFRLAGQEFDTIFAEGSARTLHGLCDGLPRVANNLIESILNLAAERMPVRRRSRWSA